jgi:KDO2-lipid IV(A) lauroyltransferase
MPRPLKRLARRLKPLTDAMVGWLAVTALRLFRRIDRRRLANFTGAAMRRIGPLLREHRLGRANLTAAFPEKSPEEIEKILAGVWDNLGRVGAEFAHIDHIRILDMDQPGEADAYYEPRTYEQYREIRDGGQPGLFFSAHLANWELPAIAATKFGMHGTILYRRPNIPAVNDAILDIRQGLMGTLIATGLDAPVRLAKALQAGGQVGMLVDQHFVKGVDVTFFGRPVKANPLIALLARHIDCPIRGVRMVRRPDRNTFWGEVTDPITPVRDAEGKIDVQGTMQVITGVVEAWVREHPEDWLWLHRRWRER